MKPLALAGSAISVAGAARSKRRMLLRLRAPRLSAASDVVERDCALIRDEEDLKAARAQGFNGAVLLEGAPTASETDGFGVTVQLGAPFEHFADGDIIGLDPGSLRFRVLYRRGSKHNAFLVTERCNHYCLMCSQPPRNIDDSWILDEIAECIELLDPTTETIGFTGGEPPLDCRGSSPCWPQPGTGCPELPFTC